ncbi:MULTISPECIES: phosphotransferase enzyme family protein [Actinomadura]|uniref:Phosphotransferase enzyme family protein n=1 Tax=Actinomadura yumaensis TaxID=111807 RepID=A0ABW2CSL6_9ACTN|nr:phosphotransferase [Actinomadura sp. J1-007]MWK37319.1 phosphotransferase [Actinomadura sp. J1-007]
MIYAEIPFSDAVREAVAAAWGVSGDGERLYGGEESVAYRVGDHVVRIGPEWRATAEAEWCHAVALHAAATLPEAVAPVPLRDGSTVVRADGRPVSVWPYVHGSWPKTDLRVQAGALLARLHRALATADPGPRPSPAGVEDGLDGTPQAHLPDPALDRWLAEFHRTHAKQALHGDYYTGNTLVRDGRLAAVLDWDEAFIGAPELELAAGAIEWGDDELSLCREFVDAYLEEGGTAGELDDESLAQLARHKLRRESAYFHVAVARGVVHDEEDVEYHRARDALFHSLRP